MWDFIILMIALIVGYAYAHSAYKDGYAKGKAEVICVRSVAL